MNPETIRVPGDANALLMQPDLASLTYQLAKTETRRVITAKDITWADGAGAKDFDDIGEFRKLPGGVTRAYLERWPGVSVGELRCRYGEAGGHLWVRENVLFCKPPGIKATKKDATYVCFEDGVQKHRSTAQVDPWTLPIPPTWNSLEKGHHWTPSIFMPEWACRSVLKIKRIRVERLQAITEEDARAEGLESRRAFLDRWDLINGPRGFTVEKNPWVFAITYERVTGHG